MAQSNVINNAKIEQASGGNAALRELIRDLANNANLTTTATNTAAGKAVPAQASANVSYLKGSYEISILNPGAVSATSAIQQAQTTATASAASTIQSVRAIYHQIRYATRPTFSVSDGVTVLGGDTGSTQTYWTLTGLGTGRFYFQVRSSYDGTNWNLWRNANGGQSITKGAEGVTQQAAANSAWAVFTMPGDEVVGFGAGFAATGDTFGVPTELYTSALQAIPGPNGFTQTGNLSHGIRNNSIVVQTPSDTSGTVGPADYPTLVTETNEDGETNQWPGSANLFGFAYDPLGTNFTVASASTGNWMIMTLPGGSKMAIGSGTMQSGAKLIIPAEMPWFTYAQMLSVVSPANAFSGDNHAHGIDKADIASDLTVTAQFRDGEGNTWSNTANWFAIALSPGLTLTAVTGGNFFIFGLPSGGRVAIGAGATASGSGFALPSGFTVSQAVTFATPVSTNDTGHAMGGVAHCSLSADPVLQQMVAKLTYQDGAQNYWDGNVSWMVFAWE